MRSPRPSRPFKILSMVVPALAALAAGCGDGDGGSSSSGHELTAVATTTQTADLVRNVGGDRVAVDQLLEPGSDPHAYEPRPSDVGALTEADLVFRSGGDVDEWLAGLIESAGGEVETVDLIDSVHVIEGGAHEHEHEHDHGAEAGDEDHAGEGEHGEHEADPHWWQDPRNAIAAVEAIRDALIDADPDGAAGYRARAEDYRRRLTRLDSEVAACIDAIPAPRRKLVTTHDALGYYAHRYGLEVVGALIPSLSTAAQPSAGDTERLVDQIEREGVPAIFPESSLSPRLEQAVARETGAEVGGALWADALGDEGSGGATYVESIESNTEAIVDGLGGGEVACDLGGR